MPYFALGMAVAAWAARRERPLGARATGALVAVGFALVAANAALHATGVAGAAAVLGTLTDLPAATGFALIVAGAVGGVGRGVTWLGVRPLAAVGVASYGLYLWHVPLLLLARRLDVLHGGFAGAFLVVLPFALATAAASWILIERPAIARAARARLLPWPARSSASQA
jgi:peptidoglycan/LPS O-acetylase OafA/YrhL